MKIIILALFFLTLYQPILLANSRDIYLIRHAEKKNVGVDPSLSAVGVQRVKNIARWLKNKHISAIYSTHYQRTKETAEPLANLLEIKVTIYDPNKLKELAEKLTKLNGNLLIVGHSNTTPQLVHLLGGKSFDKIPESEYDHIYHLTIQSGKITSQLIHSTNL